VYLNPCLLKGWERVAKNSNSGSSSESNSETRVAGAGANRGRGAIEGYCGTVGVDRSTEGS
jgi:hypothetical protein